MADETPFYSPTHKIPNRQPKPGEFLFEFHVERTHSFWRVELREHAEYGTEAQFFEGGEFSQSRRFPTRELAVALAESERQALEGDHV